MFLNPVCICHCFFVRATVLSIDSLLIQVNATMYVASLEEVEVSGDLGVGVIEGHEFVEGHHDEPGVLLLLLL